MIDAIGAWWRARSARERMLLNVAVILLFAVLAPMLIYTSAAGYRREAAGEFASAQRVAEQVETLRAAMQADPQTGAPVEGSLRERALAAAQARGLTAAQLESADQGRVRVVFSAANSVAVYRWIELMGRSGAVIERSAIARVADTELVNAEFVAADAQ